MIGIRVYLLVGLVAHKLVWELLKRGSQGPRTDSAIGPGRRLVKTAKAAFLAAIILQTLLPDVLPITDHPAWLRQVGVAVFTVGLAVALLGRLQLGGNWVDIEDARVIPGQRLVATGVYRYIRHPIYSGDVLLLIGLELSLNSWLVLGILILAPVVAWRALSEEQLLRARLPGYTQYCTETARFVPFVL